MTFQIFNLDNQTITLAEFDHVYCCSMNIEERDDQYADWFNLLECVFNIYGHLADKLEDDYFKSCFIAESRKVSLHKTAKMLLVWMAKVLYYDETIEDVDSTYKYIHRFMEFALAHKNEYYFKFRF